MASLQKKRDYIPKKHVADQLQALDATGIQLFYEQHVPLSSSNILFLKSLRLKVVAFLTPLTIVMLLITYSFRSEEFVLIFGLILSMAVLYNLVKAFLKIRQVLNVGEKTMVRGIITDRFTRKDYSDERDEDGKRSSRKNFYLVIGGRDFIVNPEIYAAYRMGEAIELHFIESTKKNKPYLLEHHKLEKAGIY